MVYDLSKPEVIKSVEFGKKFAQLLVAWFAFFFIFELILRIIFFILVLLYNQIFGSKKSSIEETDGVDQNKKVKDE